MIEVVQERLVFFLSNYIINDNGINILMILDPKLGENHYA